MLDQNTCVTCITELPKARVRLVEGAFIQTNPHDCMDWEEPEDWEVFREDQIKAIRSYGTKPMKIAPDPLPHKDPLSASAPTRKRVERLPRACQASTVLVAETFIRGGFSVQDAFDVAQLKPDGSD